MENKIYEIAIDPKFEIEANAEKVALAANWADNPWRGAAKRLEAAQKAAREDVKAQNAEAERREGESLKEAFELHRGACERFLGLSREIDALYTTVDHEAKQHNDSYFHWRKSPQGMSCEVDYRSIVPGANGIPELPPSHYLKQLGPEMAERMSKAAAHEKYIRDRIGARVGVEAQRKILEDCHPVLALIRLEAVAV